MWPNFRAYCKRAITAHQIACMSFGLSFINHYEILAAVYSSSTLNCELALEEEAQELGRTFSEARLSPKAAFTWAQPSALKTQMHVQGLETTMGLRRLGGNLPR